MMLCRYCFLEHLQGVIAGQAFTEWKCSVCGQTFVHHNTATPTVCEQCAERLGKCEMCGRDIYNDR